jgi:hypothetical protein
MLGMIEFGYVGEFNKQTPQAGFVAVCGAKATMDE